MSPWRPGQYAESLKLEEPYEDVPDHLRPLLVAWCRDVIAKHGLLTEVLLTLRMSASINPEAANALGRLLIVMERSDELTLTVAEIVLAAGRDYTDANRLEIILAGANSAYRVSDDLQRLEIRVMPEVAAATQATIDAAAQSGSAAQHLAAAWNAAYGRTPDPSKAYAEAVKAVEAAAIPAVCPNVNGATLGNVRGDLRANPQAWEFPIADGRTGTSMDRVIGAISLLWEGQEDRHAGVAPTPEVTPEAGRAAVDLAVMLVQWFVSGAVKKR